MKLCVLQPATQETSALGGNEVPRDVARYAVGHTVEHAYLHKASAVKQLGQLKRRGFDVFVNLCDGAWDQEQAGREVVEALERMHLPFTGASSNGYELSKEEMKHIARSAGISAPHGVVAADADDIAHAARELRFPLIVKHASGYDSIGMTAKSRVATELELEREATRMIDHYGQALIEELIEGRELSVLVAEDPADPARPRVYPPVECTLPPGETIKHFELKWVRYSEIKWRPCADRELARRLEEAAARYFVLGGAEGYERMDFRVDASGEIFFLESNPNCSVFYPPAEPATADVILADASGGHPAFLDRCLAAAVARHERTRPRFRVRYHRDRGYALYAITPFAEGERILAGEEQAHYLVTAAYAASGKSPRVAEWFGEYAWPMSKGVYSIWDARPDRWRPINHACDPNAWMSGLDLVARRPIAAGEQITMDYSTFIDEVMPSFDCACGAPDCRKVVRGTDHKEPWVAERYGDHVSPYVLNARRSRT